MSTCGACGDSRASARLDAIALVEAHLRDDDDSFDAILQAVGDNPGHLRFIIGTLCDMAGAELQDHHGPDADHLLAHYRHDLLTGE